MNKEFRYCLSARKEGRDWATFGAVVSGLDLLQRGVYSLSAFFPYFFFSESYTTPWY